jgi:hypothetical protein
MRRRPAGKKRDEETGLYYYGARYLDSKTSRWLSGNPAMGEYVPRAGTDGASKEQIRAAAQEVYKEHPALLDAALKFLDDLRN